MIRTHAAALFLFTVMPACQMMPERQPARLETTDTENLEALRRALAEAVGQANAELGAGDLTETATVAVLPPSLHPLETHSLAVPVLFDLVIENDRCLAVRQETGEAIALPDVRCVPKAR